MLKLLVAAALIAVLIAPGLNLEKSDFVLATATEATYVASDSGVDEDDWYTAQLPIGFDFSFYGQNQSNVFMTTNGVLNFASQAASREHNNSALNGAGRNQSIFAFPEHKDIKNVNLHISPPLPFPESQSLAVFFLLCRSLRISVPFSWFKKYLIYQFSTLRLRSCSTVFRHG